MKEKFNNYIVKLQDTICSGLERADGGSTFKKDHWKREGGGGGLTRVIENGKVFEKGGVNVSAVHGELPDLLKKNFNIEHGQFYATGLSLVLHPYSPKVPTVHANWRYFELYDDNGEIADQWFGGGQDLTPYYVDEKDAVHFHGVCKKVCDRYDPSFYSKYKNQCDDYFYNAHRHEARGIGGLFFDYLRPTENYDVDFWYNFVTDVGSSFLEAYLPIVEKNKAKEFTAEEKHWQEIRRGRYVEFNLVHDRGTLFGLKTNGRIESILMSLPTTVRWEYDYHPAKNSEEEKLIEVLKNPKQWV